MGGGSSRTVSVDNSAVNNIVTDTIMSNSASCQQDARASQVFRVDIGNAKDVVITGVSMTLAQRAQAICILSSTSNTNLAANIANALASSLTVSDVKLPSFEFGSNDTMEIKQKIVNKIATTATVQNILSGVQQLIMGQTFDVKVANAENVVISNITMDAMQQALLSATSDAVASIVQSIALENSSKTDATKTTANPLDAITNMINAATSPLRMLMIVLALLFGGIILMALYGMATGKGSEMIATAQSAAVGTT